MKLVCFSVHCDDAAFSVGSALRRAEAKDKLLVTIMSRSTYAFGRHAAAECSPLRMAEDAAFAAWAGALPHWLGLEDCSLAGLPSADRRASVLRAKKEALRRFTGKDTVVWLPMGISSHPDHRLVGELAFNMVHCYDGPCRLWLYEDLPYATRHPETQGRNTLAAHGLHYAPIEVHPSEEELISIFQCYPSQLSEEITRDLKIAVERLYPLLRGDNSNSFLGLTDNGLQCDAAS